MPDTQTFEFPVKGMDCAECVEHVEHALKELPGVSGVQVFLASEKAILRADPGLVGLPAIRQAVKQAGYEVPEAFAPAETTAPPSRMTMMQGYTRRVLTLFGIVFCAVLFIVVVGEWLGLFSKITALVPWYVGLVVVAVAGYPVFKNVVQAALKKQVISHTLMSVGVLAALAVGEWATAVVVVFFMRVGDYAEHFTTERARRAVKDLTALAPQKARLERGGEEIETPIGEVRPGDVVVVRPGEEIPVDGEVISGQASVNQASITGEAMPVEVGPGARVYASSLAQMGSLRLCATAVGADSTFGRVIRLVEEAEAHKANVQRFADKFSAYYLPVVAGVALLTFLLRRDPLATAAVLVVACSCSFALATPIAMLASIGAGAKRGLLIKGGKYLETLARADVLLVDKTGTLTLGRPQIAAILPAAGFSEDDVLALAAGAERYSEHPLAGAVRTAAAQRGLGLAAPQDFRAVPGLGVFANLEGRRVAVGSRRLLEADPAWPELTQLEMQSRTLLYVLTDGRLAGVLAADDTLRPEVGQALQETRRLGIKRVELLTGDNAASAGRLAALLGVDFRAGLLPEDKISVVKEYQAKGHVVVMVGDGINDAPALAQADVGIAMGAAGTDVAIEAAAIALMREDWLLVPQALRIARRTMGVVRGNIIFTTVYNLVGLSLAAFGILPPIFAAAAQSLPDLGILGNSSRLLKS